MPRDEAVFRTDATACLSRDLELALTRKDAVAVLDGTSGTGKTTIAADALTDISTRLAFACISHPPLTPQELLEQLLTDFGFEPYQQGHVERLQLWRQFLSEMAATETRVCLLVENAECLEPTVLGSLQSLTAGDATLSPGANVVLTTTQAGDSLLAGPAMPAFSQRVRLRRSIEPLTADETADYLEFKCRLGGVPRALVFAPDAAAALHEYTGGILRVIDSLLETALAAAAAAKEPHVSAARIADVAVSQLGMTPPGKAGIDALPDDPPAVTDGRARAIDPASIPTLTDYVPSAA